MEISKQDRRNINTILVFTSFTSLGAIINAVIEHGLNLFPIINEFIIGFLFGIIASAFEIYFFERKLRRTHFLTLLILRTFFYILICSLIIIGVAASRVGYEADITYYEALSHGNFLSYIRSSGFIELLIYSLILSFFINFIRQIDRLLGQNVLLNYIRGKYQPPVEQDLIFMFLDLNSSTTIAERLGHKRNHEFLNDFFHDMTDAILLSKGKIYQYVGDEVVLTWNLKDGIDNLNCINCYFIIRQKISDKKKYYMDNYEVYPEFKAGLHTGKVIAGEMGDIKKDIVYHGDTVNTTARIEAECNKYGKKVLASKDLIDKLNFDNEYKTESMGSIKLRGKEKGLELFSVEKS